MIKYMTRKNALRALLICVPAALILIILVYWNRIVDLIYPFIISIFTAYLLNPLVCKMEEKGIKRVWGIIIIYAAFLALLLFICFYLMPMLVRDIGKLIDNLPSYSEKIRDVVTSIQDKYSRISLPEGIKNAIDNNFVRLQGSITGYLESVTNSILTLLSKIFSIALMPILLYYFLKDYKKIGSKLVILIPHAYRKRIVRMCTSIDEVFGSYIRSQVILSLIIAVFTSLALLIIGVNFAVILGIINGITNIIPYFGPFIGGIPAVLIAFLQSPLKALYTLIAIAIIQQVESDIISPKITADIVGLHPLTVIFSLIIGGELFGMTGLILCVPAAAALKVIYNDIAKDMF